MKRSREFLCCLVLVGSLCVVFPAEGQGPPPEVNGGAPVLIYPDPEQRIRMDLQDVKVQLRRGAYNVDAIFHLFNAGRERTEWVGFLRKGNMANFVRYRLWIDGREIQLFKEPGPSWIQQGLLSLEAELPRWMRHQVRSLVKRFARLSPHESWHAQQVTFPAGARTTIRVSYIAGYVRRGWDRWAIYEYGVGAYKECGRWTGDIAAMAIRINGLELGGVDGFSVRNTLGWRKVITEDTMTLEITNHRPQVDEYIIIDLPRPAVPDAPKRRYRYAPVA